MSLRGRSLPPTFPGRESFFSGFGDLARQRFLWQCVGLGALAGLLLVLAAYIRLASASRVTPYVVEVDRLGQVLAFGPAERPRDPDPYVIQAGLTLFVRDLRCVFQDPVAQATLFRAAYDHVALHDGGAFLFLNQYFSQPENDPRLLASSLKRLPHDISVLPLPGARGGHRSTWRVHWLETTYPLSGSLPTTAAWDAFVTVKLQPPHDLSILRVNPIGLWVTDLTWTQTAEEKSR